MAPETKRLAGDVRPSIIQAIGKQYVEADELPGERSEDEREAVAEGYETITSINETKFDRMLDEIDVEFTPDDPYDSYENMESEVSETGLLKVFSGGTGAPMLTKTENVIGRAVHDYYGHLDAGCDFSPEGEYTKWSHVWPDYCDTRFDIESRIMFAEVVGQLCAAHYLEDGFADERFEQRAIAAPKAWIAVFERYFDEQ